LRNYASSARLLLVLLFALKPAQADNAANSNNDAHMTPKEVLEKQIHSQANKACDD